jgi:hypothetical protein
MVACRSRTMVACSLSSCIAAIHQSLKVLTIIRPETLCVGTEPAFATIGVGSRAHGEGDRRSKRICAR